MSRPTANSLSSQAGGLSFAWLLLAAVVPLVAIGKYHWAISAMVAYLVAALCRAMNDKITAEDKLEIRFNVLDAEHVLAEMIQAQDDLKDDGTSATDARMIIGTGLHALAKKYGQKRNDDELPDRLPVLCQHAAYVGFHSFSEDDAVVAASVSLLALVAKSIIVRERSLELKEYGLELPIQCMRQALVRAKTIQNDNAKEQAAAELQRKGCLMLGALSDGSVEISRHIVEQGGLDAILQAVQWYRCHADVANWALWAIFNLCFENLPNKVAVVQAGGVPIVIETMSHNPDSLEVARHGIAILFDLMRQQQPSQQHEPVLDVWRIRNTALTAGLHEVVVHAMKEFPDAMDIHMMGQEILAGTDYRGEIPRFVPTK